MSMTTGKMIKPIKVISRFSVNIEEGEIPKFNEFFICSFSNKLFKVICF